MGYIWTSWEFLRRMLITLMIYLWIIWAIDLFGVSQQALPHHLVLCVPSNEFNASLHDHISYAWITLCPQHVRGEHLYVASCWLACRISLAIKYHYFVWKGLPTLVRVWIPRSHVSALSLVLPVFFTPLTCILPGILPSLAGRMSMQRVMASGPLQRIRFVSIPTRLQAYGYHW